MICHRQRHRIQLHLCRHCKTLKHCHTSGACQKVAQRMTQTTPTQVTGQTTSALTTITLLFLLNPWTTVICRTTLSIFTALQESSNFCLNSAVKTMSLHWLTSWRPPQRRPSPCVPVCPRAFPGMRHNPERRRDRQSGGGKRVLPCDSGWVSP